MPSQSVSSRVVPATVGVRAALFRATVSRVARLMWRSSERHGLYQAMLAAGHDEGVRHNLVHDPRQTGPL
jgi:hypothetical protein